MNEECDTFDLTHSSRYSWPNLIYYDTATCVPGTASVSHNVVNEFPCSLVGPSGAGDAVDPVITANSYMKYNLASVPTAAPTASPSSQPFPANPIYATTQVFDQGCGTPLTAVESTLTNWCYSNGQGSVKYSCSK
jgi:hypothetical protein